MAEEPLRDIIPMDDAICALTPEGVLIDPLARPSRWVVFWAMGALAVLAGLLFIFSILTLPNSFWSVLSWLLRNVLLLIGELGLLSALYMQWKALRRPVVAINPQTELIEVIWANGVRRIPFPAVTSLRIAADPVENRIDVMLNRLAEALPLQVSRRGIGFVLQHGEVVWCGVVSGADARERARAIRHRISECITSTR